MLDTASMPPRTKSLKGKKKFYSSSQKKQQPKCVPMAGPVEEDDSIKSPTESAPHSRLTDTGIMKLVKESLPSDIYGYAAENTPQQEAREPEAEDSQRETGWSPWRVGRNEYFLDSTTDTDIHTEANPNSAPTSTTLTSLSALASVLTPAQVQDPKLASGREPKPRPATNTDTALGEEEQSVCLTLGSSVERSMDSSVETSIVHKFSADSYSQEATEATATEYTEATCNDNSAENGLLSWFNGFAITNKFQLPMFPVASAGSVSSASSFSSYTGTVEQDSLFTEDVSPSITQANEENANSPTTTRLVYTYKKGLSQKAMPTSPSSGPVLEAESQPKSRSAQLNSGHPPKLQKSPPSKSPEKKSRHSKPIQRQSSQNQSLSKSPKKKQKGPQSIRSTSPPKQLQSKTPEKKQKQSQPSRPSTPVKQLQSKTPEKKQKQSQASRPSTPVKQLESKTSEKKQKQSQPSRQSIPVKQIQSKTPEKRQKGLQPVRSTSPQKRSQSKTPEKRQKGLQPVRSTSPQKRSQSMTVEKRQKGLQPVRSTSPQKRSRSRSKTPEKRQSHSQLAETISPKKPLVSKVPDAKREQTWKSKLRAAKFKAEPKAQPKKETKGKLVEEKKNELDEKPQEEATERQNKKDNEVDFAALHDKLLDLLFQEQHGLKNAATQEEDTDKTTDISQNCASTEKAKQVSDKEGTSHTVATTSSRSSKRSVFSRASFKKIIRSKKKKKAETKENLTKEENMKTAVKSSTAKVPDVGSTDQPEQKDDANQLGPSITNNISTSEVKNFISPKCNLQKDKGKGSPLGTELSATGRDGSLLKLREKIDILVDVEKKGTRGASMKKNSAVLMCLPPKEDKEGTTKVAETRSTIDLRMGFLSMKYGILLHWDCSGMEDVGNWKPSVILIVLRKTCDKNFLNGAMQTSDTKVSKNINDDKTSGDTKEVDGEPETSQKLAEEPSSPKPTTLMIHFGMFNRDRLEMVEQVVGQESKATSQQKVASKKSRQSNNQNSASEMESAKKALSKSPSNRSFSPKKSRSTFRRFSRRNKSKQNNPQKKDEPAVDNEDNIEIIDEESEVKSTWVSTTGSFPILQDAQISRGEKKQGGKIFAPAVVHVSESEPIAETDDASGINPAWAMVAPPTDSKLVSRLMSKNKKGSRGKRMNSSQGIKG